MRDEAEKAECTIEIKGTDFSRDLESLINRYSKENESNTPDFLLANFMIGCMASFNNTVNAREAWHGRKKSS